MKRFASIGLALLVGFALNACSGGSKTEQASQPVQQVPSPAQSPGRTPDQARLAAGFALFNKSCRVCHGNQGNGNGSRPGPSLQRGTFTHGRSRDAILESIRNGRPGGMPAYGKVFSLDQLEALTDYVLTFNQ